MDGRFNYSAQTRIEVGGLFALGHGALLNSGGVSENKIYSLSLKVAAVEKFLAGTPNTQVILEFDISTRAVFDKWGCLS